MAVSASNPFYIKPATADFTPILQGLGAISKRKREEDKRSRNQTALMDAYKSKDTDKVASLLAKNPELGASMSAMLKHRSEATEKNYSDSIREMVRNPSEIETILENRIQTVIDAEGDPRESAAALEEYRSDPDSFNKGLELEYARTATKQEWSAYKAQKTAGTPSLKEREFALKVQAQDLKSQQFDQKKDMDAVKVETDELKRQDLQSKINERAANISASQAKIEKQAVTDRLSASTLRTNIKNLIGNKGYMRSVTGWRGRTPTTTDQGIEAMGYFDQIKSSLTLENLDKMTGILSDTDIKILSGAASALNAGMGEVAMRRELKKIDDILVDKIAYLDKNVLSAKMNEDIAATEWARSNPDDPRSAQILKMQGEK